MRAKRNVKLGGGGRYRDSLTRRCQLETLEKRQGLVGEIDSFSAFPGDGQDVPAEVLQLPASFQATEQFYEMLSSPDAQTWQSASGGDSSALLSNVDAAILASTSTLSSLESSGSSVASSDGLGSGSGSGGSSAVPVASELLPVGNDTDERPVEKNHREVNFESIFVDHMQDASGYNLNPPLLGHPLGEIITQLPPTAREAWNPTLPDDNIFGIRPPRAGDHAYIYNNLGPVYQYTEEARPSLTINFDYGNGFFDPVNPLSSSFGPYWGGSYQSVMNDHVLWLSESMTEDQWRHAAEILRDYYPNRIGTVQIVGHGTSYSTGPFNMYNINHEGGRRDFLLTLAATRPTEVYLRTCWSGGNHDLLQQLANLIDADVYAGDGNYIIRNWGQWWLALPNNGGVEMVR